MVAACPPEEQLAQFLDGTLVENERAGVLEHVRVCTPCYEAALTIAEVSYSRDLDVLEANSSLSAFRRIGRRLRVALSPAQRYRRALLSSAARLPERPTQGRLSNWRRYIPFRGNRDEVSLRSAGFDWKLASSQATVRTAAASSPSPRTLHALGIAELLLRRYDESIQALSTAIQLSVPDVEVPIAFQVCRDYDLLNDISVAYYERGVYRQSASIDLSAALMAIDCAFRRAPYEADVLFNRALVLQAYGFRNPATRAWLEYLRVDAQSPWAAEARDSISRIATLDPFPND